MDFYRCNNCLPNLSSNSYGDPLHLPKDIRSTVPLVPFVRILDLSETLRGYNLRMALFTIIALLG